MIEIGDSVIRGAQEALEIAKGKLAPDKETEAECAAGASDRATIRQVPSLERNSQDRS
jgi:hypothetical protein